MRRAVLPLAALVLVACTRGFERSAEALRSPAVSEASPSGTTGTTTSPAPSSPGGTIRIRAPRAGDEVASPVEVRGVAATAEGEVLVRVVDAQGTDLGAMYVEITCGAGCRGRFEARLAFYVPVRQTGLVQALELGPGGVVAQLAEIPVTLVPGS